MKTIQMKQAQVGDSLLLGNLSCKVIEIGFYFWNVRVKLENGHTRWVEVSELSRLIPE